jgi:uncharacterized membrane protein
MRFEGLRGSRAHCTACAMSLDSRLDAWVAAGLMDLATADAIRAHEARRERPTARWAIAGLGLLAVALGIILIISANWDRIPAALKLGTHLALLAGLGAAHWATRARHPRLSEGALFLFAGLVLGGIALQSQIYQLTGPVWHALLLWLAIAGPALLVGGQTRLTGLAFAAMALIGPAVMAIDTVEAGGAWRLAQGLAMAVPALLIGLSIALPAGPGFRLALREAGIVSILAGASLAHFAWASNITAVQAADNIVRLVPAALASLAVIALGWKRQAEIPRALLLPLLAGPPLAFALALAFPHPDTMASRLAGIAVFMGLWAAIARAAAGAGWTSLFGVAIAAIGLRIFIIYIELFGSLAQTGGGLIVGGALLVGLSWLWHRIVTRRKVAAA